MRLFAFITALILAAVLVIAAVGKLFFPITQLEVWRVFDFMIAGLELLFAGCLLVFYERWQSWAASAVLLASWAGFSLFWFMEELPCGCLGKMVALPNGTTLCFDLLFFLLALLLLRFFGRIFYSVVGLALACGVVGYFSAEWLYLNLLLPELVK